MRGALYPTLYLLLVLPSVGTAVARAQSGWSDLVSGFVSTVNVTLDHPPSLGLDVERIAFAAPEGECSEELANAVIEDFVNNGVEVIERQRLEEIFQEIDLSVSGYINSKDALSIGQISGANALIFLSTQRCGSEQKHERKSAQTQNGTVYTYYSTTRVSLKGSLRIVDLTTGRIFTAKTVEASPFQTVSSNEGYPSFPSEFEVKDAALRSAQTQIHRMFFPWSEVKNLRFFNTKKCDLELAFQMLKIGDIEGAAQKSLENLERCKSDPKAKPKLLGKAYYNVGMSYFIQDKYDEALEYLQQAFNYRTGSYVQETILECKKAKEEAEKMQQYEDRMAMVRSDEGKEQAGQSDVPSPFPSSGDKPQKSIKERLETLKELHEQGLLSDEEYEAKKAEILAKL